MLHYLTTKITLKSVFLLIFHFYKRVQSVPPSHLSEVLPVLLPLRVDEVNGYWHDNFRYESQRLHDSRGLPYISDESIIFSVDDKTTAPEIRTVSKKLEH